MKKVLFKILIGLSSLFVSVDGIAQSALYFQGDKETGIYVKVEGKMMERLGRDFVIVPGLEAGEANFEVLFEQNKYPAQKFKIRIPENGIRGFVISRQNDGSFALFDVQTNGYIPANNTEDPAYLDIPRFAKTFFPSGKRKSTETGLPPFEPGAQDEVVNISTSSTEEKRQSRFIEDLDLNQPKESKRKSSQEEHKAIFDENKIFKTQEDGVVKKSGLEEKVEEEVVTTVTSGSGMCNEAISNSAFENYAKNFQTAGDDDAKLKYFKRSYKKECFNTEQIGILASLLNLQSSRYELVQMAISRTSDPENYEVLEGLFATDFMKRKFKELLK